jgi:hypothetical protein
MKWSLSINEVTEDAMEDDDIEPAPLENPFLDVPTGLVSKNWAFVLLGDPGIGERSCFLSDHSDIIYYCRENCTLTCFTGSACNVSREIYLVSLLYRSPVARCTEPTYIVDVLLCA